MNNGKDKDRDRISELPDALLSYILSFLETKWAFRTTALSKRWRNLVWNSLSTLHFDESNFRRQCELKKCMDHILARRDKTLALNKLIFITNRSSSSKFAITLIDYAMSHASLKHLQLSLPDAFNWWLDHLLDIKALPISLRILKLKADRPVFPFIETLFCLPKLQVLHLQGFDLALNLLSECENLVELSIVNCRMDEKLIISAPQLESLKISDLYNGDDYVDTPVMLTSPKLTAFKLEEGCYDIPVFHSDEFFNLNTARLNITTNFGEREVIMNLLQKLRHAQHVSLSLPTFELFGALEVQVSPFSNLKTFRITTKEKSELNTKSVSISGFNQVLNAIFQISSDVELFIDFPRPSKRPRI